MRILNTLIGTLIWIITYEKGEFAEYVRDCGGILFFILFKEIACEWRFLYLLDLTCGWSQLWNQSSNSPSCWHLKGDLEEVPDVSGTINIMTYRFSGSVQFSLLVQCTKVVSYIRVLLKVSGSTACLTPLRSDVLARLSCCSFVFDYWQSARRTHYAHQYCVLAQWTNVMRQFHGH